jgi:CRISPR-associated protein Cst2
MHATRYQYGFAITPERLKMKKRCLDILDGLSSLGEVAGNHGRFLFDFAPASIILRVAEDPAPRILYCFGEEDGKVNVSELIRKVESKDVLPEELFIGGLIAELQVVQNLNPCVCDPGIKKVVQECKKMISQELDLEITDGK